MCVTSYTIYNQVYVSILDVVQVIGTLETDNWNFSVRWEAKETNHVIARTWKVCTSHCSLKVFSPRDIQGQCGWHLGKTAPSKREQIDWPAKRSPSMAKYGKLCVVWQLGSCILQLTDNACSNADTKSPVLLHKTKKHHYFKTSFMNVHHHPGAIRLYSNSMKKYLPLPKNGYTRHLNKKNTPTFLPRCNSSGEALELFRLSLWQDGRQGFQEFGNPKGREPPHEFGDKHWIHSHVWIPFRECGPWWNE